jgi:hypothetical protein
MGQAWGRAGLSNFQPATPDIVGRFLFLLFYVMGLASVLGWPCLWAAVSDLGLRTLWVEFSLRPHCKLGQASFGLKFMSDCVPLFY